MRVPHHRHRGGVSFNMTPMIDVTFLLIVFFLVSSHLARQEVQLELNLPRARSGQRPDEAARRIVVNVLPQGEIRTGGRTVDGRQLERIFQVERREAGDELEIRIRSDRDVPYRFVEPIMIAAARAGVWKVTFAVVQQPDA